MLDTPPAAVIAAPVNVEYKALTFNVEPLATFNRLSPPVTVESATSAFIPPAFTLKTAPSAALTTLPVMLLELVPLEETAAAPEPVAVIVLSIK
ncbi:hypothetical protein APY04_1925 [Hyphomicrobium sulfonivorans]|uniref:Uncharacterized protein n=1 Tax=Hyphomicrobium sulfonivorans TaxID=121290 RepID=A0A109BEX1_HYPSL|nr:hypothetical protein APY04_1925 [Hyphomicrobium sulfonivorans]